MTAKEMFEALGYKKVCEQLKTNKEEDGNYGKKI